MDARVVCAVVAGFAIGGGSFACVAYHRVGVRYVETGMQAAGPGGGARSLLPPGSAIPRIGQDGTQLDYVRWAKNALSRGLDAEAEISLERAQLQERLDRDAAALEHGEPAPVDDNDRRLSIYRAMEAIGMGRTFEAMTFIDTAIASLTPPSDPNTKPANWHPAQAKQDTVAASPAGSRPVRSGSWWTWQRFCLIGTAWITLNALFVALKWSSSARSRGAALAGRVGYGHTWRPGDKSFGGNVQVLRPAYAKPAASRSPSPRPAP